ncbi:MAG: Crp/Fnr family transcriptional regulator [Pseudohongiella sp.]|nr:Crp/Fnr family transcriptional regulator [Pseudohongiella sp.]
MTDILKPKPQHNHILAALTPDVQRRLFLHLELVPLPLRASIYDRKSELEYVYFPTDSIVSLQCQLQDGSSTALSVVGNEGLLGINFFLTEVCEPTRGLVQSPGYAYRLPRRRVREEFDRHCELMLLMLRYTQTIITQVSQSAICIRHHSIKQQLCRWLLISTDRLSHPRLKMTHEFIGVMLGVRRESISEAASNLQQLGAITYSRGLIEVVDRTKLEAMACECYFVVKKEADLLLAYLPQHQVFPDTDAIPVHHLGQAGDSTVIQ